MPVYKLFKFFCSVAPYLFKQIKKKAKKCHHKNNKV